MSNKNRGNPRYRLKEDEIEVIRHYRRIKEQVVELYKLEVEDRNSARAREVKMTEAGSNDWMMNATGIIGLGSFCFLVFAIVFITVPEANAELLIHTTGIYSGS